MKCKFKLSAIAIGIALSSCSIFTNRSVKPQSPTAGSITQSTISAKIDTNKNVSGLKPYKDVITVKAVSNRGLLTIHRIAEKYFLELNDTILNKDMLIVNRIIRGPKVRVGGGYFGFAGDLIGENLVRFEKGQNNKIFIRQLAYSDKAVDTGENGLSRAFSKSNLEPIIAAFDIKAFTQDSAGIVIELTDFLKGDNSLLSFDLNSRKTYKPGILQVDKSYIIGTNSFPMNTEIKIAKTFMADNILSTYEINSSIVLLPKVPMQPRLLDPRVGYFGISFMDFDKNSQMIENTAFINKWRLEPRPQDIEKYKRGELVEPVKPIIYYIDPATPKKWVKYLIQGVNDWQVAFEKAGFKNAIYALEAPKNDPNWSLEDVRHSAIVYKATDIANASGPHVHDPRTGEILETHIHWYHGVMKLLHDWYMVQAGPNDIRARKPTFDDELMGTLIRFVSSHEVGHTLGLGHNFIASKAVPVEKLRDKAWVESNGFCPSIMDYARFNYVAQPEDHIGESGIMPRIGVYDKWAIEWGYKLQPSFSSQEEERLYNNRLIIARTSQDKRLLFVSEGNREGSNVLTEDIGDDAMIASSYGVENLKRVMSELPNWMYEPGKTRWAYKEMRDQVLKQFSRYIGHVYATLSGPKITYLTQDQPGSLWEFNSRSSQKRAVQWFNKNVFTTPKWLLDKSLYERVVPSGLGNSGEILKIQKAALNNLLDIGIFAKIRKNEELNPTLAYKFPDYLSDIKAGIWSELANHHSIDIYRRNLQKEYIFQLGYFLVDVGNIFDPKSPSVFVQMNRFLISSELNVKLRDHAKSLLSEIKRSKQFFSDNETLTHLKTCENLLTISLSGKQIAVSTSPSPATVTLPTEGFDHVITDDEYLHPIYQIKNFSCWYNDLNNN